jgi:hypothetical protein
MDLLPPELLKHIFLFLSTYEIHISNRVCRKWSDVVRSYKLLKDKFSQLALSNYKTELFFYRDLILCHNGNVYFLKKWLDDYIIIDFYNQKEIIRTNTRHFDINERNQILVFHKKKLMINSSGKRKYIKIDYCPSERPYFINNDHFVLSNLDHLHFYNLGKELTHINLKELVSKIKIKDEIVYVECEMNIFIFKNFLYYKTISSPHCYCNFFSIDNSENVFHTSLDNFLKNGEQIVTEKELIFLENRTVSIKDGGVKIDNKEFSVPQYEKIFFSRSGMIMVFCGYGKPIYFF